MSDLIRLANTVKQMRSGFRKLPTPILVCTSNLISDFHFWLKGILPLLQYPSIFIFSFANNMVFSVRITSYTTHLKLRTDTRQSLIFQKKHRKEQLRLFIVWPWISVKCWRQTKMIQWVNLPPAVLMISFKSTAVVTIQKAHCGFF